MGPRTKKNAESTRDRADTESHVISGKKYGNIMKDRRDAESAVGASAKEDLASNLTEQILAMRVKYTQKGGSVVSAGQSLK